MILNFKITKNFKDVIPTWRVELGKHMCDKKT